MKAVKYIFGTLVLLGVTTGAFAQQVPVIKPAHIASKGLSSACQEEIRRRCPQTSEPDRHGCIEADKNRFSNQCKLQLENRGY